MLKRRRPGRRGSLSLASGALVAVLAGSAIAVAAPKLPLPGTSSQISRAVAASTKITKLSSSVAKKVVTAASDNPAVDYPLTKNGCAALNSCVFGDKKSTKKLIVLGDSHAQMWIPALNRIGAAYKLKVIVLFLPRCPAATLDVWLMAFHTSYTACSSTRAAWITSIDQLHPVTVLLTDHTNDVFTAASGGTVLFTSAQWQAGLQATITALLPSKAKLAVIGDFTTFDQAPSQCLAAFPTQVQKCDAPNPNPDRPDQQAAEVAAAKAANVLYVNPSKWLCTSTACSPVIGSFIVYYDAFHLTCSYAAYLSGVLQTALKKVL